MSVLRDPDASQPARRRAIDEAGVLLRSGDAAARGPIREALKALAWSSPSLDLRLRALDAVLADEAGEADSRAMACLMVPRDPEPLVVARLSREFAARNWREGVPALVRSLSRARAGVRDEDRGEYEAIRLLEPDRSVGEVTLGVFLDPPEGEWSERARADAWTLLARLDREGELRLSLIAPIAREDDPPTVAAIRECIGEFHTIPFTGEEIAWLDGMRADEAFRREVRACVAGLGPGQRRGLRLRHLAALRWASHHRPEWLALDAGEIESLLSSRLAREPRHARRVDRDGPAGAYQERFEVLVREGRRPAWGDVLGALVLREALDDPRITAALARQADLDREDRTTEYGGLLGVGEDGALKAALYPPRPAQRVGDHDFVASDELLADSAASLAHYHFHAQKEANATFAGPSPADRAYAARLGRACVVFTSVGAGSSGGARLGADYYAGAGAEALVIDLGEVGAR